MKILDRGRGAGFVGSHFALALKQVFTGSRVIALDNLKRRGSELNVPRLRSGGVEFIHGDVRNPADLDITKPDWIIECSAEPSALAGRNGDVDYLVHTNLLGTYHCLELARRHRSKMVFLSTSRVYPIHGSSSYPLTNKKLASHSGHISTGSSKMGLLKTSRLEGQNSLWRDQASFRNVDCRIC